MYDLSPINEFGYPIGLGVFHSGLEVSGREYTFAGGGGIFDHEPRKGEAFDMYCTRIIIIYLKYLNSYGVLIRRTKTNKSDSRDYHP